MSQAATLLLVAMHLLSASSRPLERPWVLAPTVTCGTALPFHDVPNLLPVLLFLESLSGWRQLPMWGDESFCSIREHMQQSDHLVRLRM
jgi:hypothetical protein